MNKEQIKAELRRSACEDKDPACDINEWAYYTATSYLVLWYENELVKNMKQDDCRTFFLLVAEAL